MRFWQFLPFEEPGQLVELARIAEDVGFHGVLLGDHLAFPEKLQSPYPYSADGRPGFGPETPWPDPWVTLGAMASVTTRLRLSTSIYILPLRHPLHAAKAISTAAVLSGGRVALGTGVGWMREEFEAVGEDFAHRGRRTDEMVQVLRKLWSGEVVEHHGAHFDFDALRMRPAPPEPIPIYIGGASAPALRRAARLGDGWISAGSTPKEIPGVLARLQQLRREAGREHLPFETLLSVAAPPELDRFRRLRDEGVTAVVNWPLRYVLGPDSSLERKRQALEDYAERFIQPFG